MLLEDRARGPRANQGLAVALLNQETGYPRLRRSGDADLDPSLTATAGRGARPSRRCAGNLAERPATQRQVDDVEAAVRPGGTGYASPWSRPATAGRLRTRPSARPSSTRLRAPLGRAHRGRGRRAAGRAEALNGAADALRWVGIAIAVVMAAFLVAAAWGCGAACLEPIAALPNRSATWSRATSSTRSGQRPAGDRRARRGRRRDAPVHPPASSTRLQRVNQRLDDQARDLERSNRDLEQFAYVA